MEQWPSPLVVAKAMADLLTERLDDFYAEQIVLSRDEAALCLGLVMGLVEQLEKEERKPPRAP